MGPRPRPWWRRALRWLLIAGAVLGGLVLVAVLLLHTDWARERVRVKLEAELQKRLRGEVSIRELSGGLLGDVVLHDVVIADQSGQPAVSVERLELDFRLLPLLGEHFHADRLAIDGLAITARRGPDGRFRLADLWIQQPPSDEAPWTATLEEISVSRGAVAVEVAPGHLERVDDLALAAAVRVSGGGAAIDLERLSARWRSRALPLAAEGRVVLGDGGAIRAERVAIRAGQSELVVPVARQGREGTRGMFHAELRAETVRAVAGGSPLLADVTVSGFFHRAGDAAPWQVALCGGGGGGSLAVVGEVRAPGAALAAEPAPEPPSRAVLFWAGVDPARLVRGGPAGGVAGWATADLSGPDLAAARGRVIARARGSLGGQEIDRAEIGAELDGGRVRLAAELESRVADVVAAAAIALPAGPGAWRRATIESSEVTARVADLAAAERALGREPTLAGEATVVARLAGPLLAPAVDARVTSGSVRRGDLRLSGVRAQVDLTEVDGGLRGTARASVRQVIQGGQRLGGGTITARFPGGPTGTVTFDLGGGGIPRIKGRARVRLLESKQEVRGAAHRAPAQSVIALPSVTLPRSPAAPAPAAPASPRAAPRPRARPAGLAISGVEIELDELAIDTGRLVWRADGGSIRVAGGGRELSGEIHLRSRAGRVRVEVDLTRARGVLRGPVDFDADLAPGELLTAFGIEQSLAGRIAARGELRLPAGPGWIEAEATGEGLTAAAGLAVRGRVRADIDRRQLTARVEAAAGPLGSARAELSARAPANLIDAAAWRRLGPAAVDALQVDADGVSLARAGELAGLPQLRAGELELHLRAAAGLDGGRLTVAISGAEVATWVPEPPGRRTPAPAVRRRAGRQASDRSVVRLDARAEAALSASEITFALDADLGRRGLVDLDLTAGRPARLLDPAAWRRGGLGLLRFAQVEARGVHLDQLEPLLPPAEVGAGRPRLELSGIVDAELSTGPGGDRIAARVALDRVRTRHLAIPISGELRALVGPRASGASVELRAGIEPILRGEAAMDLGTAALSAGADANRLLAEARRAALRADIDIPAQPVARLIETAAPGPEVSGMVAGRATVAGALASPRVTATLRAPGLTLEGVRFDDLAIDGRHGPDGWAAVARARQRGGGRIDLTASSDGGGADGELAVRLRAADLDLAFLRPALVRPGGGLTHLGGTLGADLAVAGTPAAPRIDGWLRLRELEARIPRFLRPLHDGQVDVVVRDSRATINARAASRPGRVDLRGTVELRRPAGTTFSLRARGRDLPVMAGSQLASVNGYARARGRLRDGLWVIDTQIERGLVVRLPDGGEGELHETGPLDDVVFVDAAGIAAREARERAKETAMGLRMTVVTDERITIRGNNVYTEAEVDVVVTRLGGATSVAGTVTATRGWVEINGRRYDIERAWVVLEGESPPDPRLDIRIAHRFPSTTVFVDVVGPLSDPQVSFASDSGRYDQAQLLALVLGGEGGPAGGDGVGGAATGAVASLIAAQVTSAIRQSGLPIDSLRVGTEGGADQQVTHVTVGKWITDRLFVAYRRRFEADVDENANEGVFQHFFARDWMWEGIAGDRGTASFDVLWVVPF